MQLGDYMNATPDLRGSAGDPSGGMGGGSPNALAGLLGTQGAVGGNDPWGWLTAMLAQYGLNPQGSGAAPPVGFDARFGGQMTPGAGSVTSPLLTPNALQSSAVVPPTGGPSLLGGGAAPQAAVASPNLISGAGAGPTAPAANALATLFGAGRGGQ